MDVLQSAPAAEHEEERGATESSDARPVPHTSEAERTALAASTILPDPEQLAAEVADPSTANLAAEVADSSTANLAAEVADPSTQAANVSATVVENSGEVLGSAGPAAGAHAYETEGRSIACQVALAAGEQPSIPVPAATHDRSVQAAVDVDPPSASEEAPAAAPRLYLGSTSASSAGEEAPAAVPSHRALELAFEAILDPWALVSSALSRTVAHNGSRGLASGPACEDRPGREGGPGCEGGAAAADDDMRVALAGYITAALTISLCSVSLWTTYAVMAARAPFVAHLTSSRFASKLAMLETPLNDVTYLAPLTLGAPVIAIVPATRVYVELLQTSWLPDPTPAQRWRGLLSETAADSVASDLSAMLDSRSAYAAVSVGAVGSPPALPSHARSQPKSACPQPLPPTAVHAQIFYCWGTFSAFAPALAALLRRAPIRPSSLAKAAIEAPLAGLLACALHGMYADQTTSLVYVLAVPGEAYTSTVSSCLRPRSSFLVPRSSFLLPPSYVLLPPSSFLLPTVHVHEMCTASSSLLPTSSLLLRTVHVHVHGQLLSPLLLTPLCPVTCRSAHSCSSPLPSAPSPSCDPPATSRDACSAGARPIPPQASRRRRRRGGCALRRR